MNIAADSPCQFRVEAGQHHVQDLGALFCGNRDQLYGLLCGRSKDAQFLDTLGDEIDGLSGG